VSTPAIRLVLSDVDGTLVTSGKVLTIATIRAVERLHEADIHFAITSGRPPRGLTMLIEPLKLTTPLSAFNGGLIVDRDLKTLKELEIKDEFVTPIIQILQGHDLSVWVYQGTDWFVLDLNGPHVAHESKVCQFEPSQLDSFDHVHGNIIKIVGVSDDPAVVAKGIAALAKELSDDVSASNSQSYYVDVTHRDANKGRVVDYLAKEFSLKRQEIAVIGDMSNDLLMFERAGVSFAVANAPGNVQGAATHVTTSNDGDGFANAMTEFVLGSS
jgi:Cof subfamily protein (haloacid dehalogenase superfamily)